MIRNYDYDNHTHVIYQLHTYIHISSLYGGDIRTYPVHWQQGKCQLWANYFTNWMPAFQDSPPTTVSNIYIYITPHVNPFFLNYQLFSWGRGYSRRREALGYITQTRRNPIPKKIILEQGVSKHIPINGLAQDCSNYNALEMELLQFWTNPSIWIS